MARKGSGFLTKKVSSWQLVKGGETPIASERQGKEDIHINAGSIAGREISMSKSWWKVA